AEKKKEEKLRAWEFPVSFSAALIHVEQKAACLIIVFANGEMSKLLFTRIDEHVLIFLFSKHPFCKILLFPHTSQQIIIKLKMVRDNM
ncbi:hypothetical protein ACJX0J_014810, partial [Zea mays]